MAQQRLPAVERDGHLEVLTRDDCFSMLRAHAGHVGRVAVVNDHGFPHVVPVNYAVDGNAVVFRTGIGTKLDRIARSFPSAFQVDEVDAAGAQAWSVMLQGVAHEIVDAPEVARVAALLGTPLAGGNRSRLIRLRPRHVSGRRIAPRNQP